MKHLLRAQPFRVRVAQVVFVKWREVVVDRATARPAGWGRAELVVCLFAGLAHAILRPGRRATVFARFEVEGRFHQGPLWLLLRLYTRRQFTSRRFADLNRKLLQLHRAEWIVWHSVD